MQEAKYCQADNITLPEPYFPEVPVSVKTPEDWVLGLKPMALFLPHEWLPWLLEQELASGFSHLEQFWAEHDMGDPKFVNNPAAEEDISKFLPLVLHGDAGSFQRGDSIMP